MSTAVVESSIQPSPLVRLLLHQAEQLAERGRHAEARFVLDAAVAADSTPVARIARAVHLAAHDPDQALAELDTAWDAARTTGSAHLRTVCCRNLAWLYQRLGNVHQASRFLQLAISAEMDTPEFQTDAAWTAGLLIDVAGHWSETEDQAATDTLLGAATVQAINDSQRADVAAHRGVLSAERGDMAQARHDFQQAEQQYGKQGDLAGSAHALLNLGHLLQSEQRYKEARCAFQRAGTQFDAVNAPEAAITARAFDREAAAHERRIATNPLSN